MSDMDVDEVKQQNTYNSLLKNKEKPKDPIIEEPVSKSKRVVFQDKPIILNKVASKTSDGLSTKNDTNESEKNREKKERVRPPTKVVVRRLPPTMTLETFVDHVSPMPEHDYIYFVKADMSLGANSFSRAYINFVNISDLLTFYEQFDNYVFMDNKGNEYPAVVEFAPFQRVPKKRPGRKKDPKAGTLKDDPAYIAFVQSLREKKDANAAKQTSAEHLLALTTENSSKKEVTTPLLEFLKQRRAERQRIRDEKREERRRKELERKRIKEEERRRRKEGDSVLRNPDHDDKDDAGRGSKDRDRDRPQSSLRKREDERQRNRDKDKKDARQMQDNRQRDIKGRGDSGPKSYREDRQKQMDSRMQRKALDEQRKKPGLDRNQGPNKLSDTRRSQEFDRPGHVKDSDSRKKDVEEKKTYGDRHSRDGEPRKGYRDSDMKRSDRNQGYNKDYDRRKNSYSSDRKYSHSYGDSDSRRRSNDYKIHSKPDNKHVKESKTEVSKTVQSQDETEDKKWELLGAKPKNKAAPATTDEKKMEETEEEMEVQEDVKKTEELKDPPGFVLKRRNSVDSSDVKDMSSAKSDGTTEAASDTKPRRRSSLESDVDKRSSNEFDVKPRRQSSLDPEVSVSEAPLDAARKSIQLSKSQEFEKTACSEVVHKRRGSLDSGDHDVDGKSKAEAEKLDRNGSVDSKEGASSLDKDRGDSANRSDENGGGTDADRKRDPRAERRIRNKDRPSIEIYRPGMGRFSMQRKEREKGVGSSTEQDSPSTSPSPTPSGRVSKTTKSNQELRSMTFKRSVSREK
ncbi:regulator of nonsense transcripts 3B isoform X2 [Anabrus simplex]|uniref:regulator of nonsense transcripts 3B isoform X2 n=1 Tax=Anabrus simplex TaxID=316456 RepID=UPI0035A31707